MNQKDAKAICKILGIGQETLRIGLKDKVFKFGDCVGESSYVLYPPKVFEYTGYRMEGYDEKSELPS